MSPSVAWGHEFQSWLEPFLKLLRHPARRRMCPLYVAGLISPGVRKSLQPMAARLAPADYDQLHHFVTVGPQDETPLEAELLARANQLVGGPDAVLVIDDTALLKQGTNSVDVGPQYAGAVGQKANCQALVVLTLAKDEVPIPIVLRLFLARHLDQGSRPLAARQCACEALAYALASRSPYTVPPPSDQAAWP